VGRPWERKFLGFRINLEGKIEVAPKRVERFKPKVREYGRSGQSLSSNELRDRWRGRRKKLEKLGLNGGQLKAAPSSKGAWRLAASPSLHQALSNALLRRLA
jgi:hypothetical protein